MVNSRQPSPENLREFEVANRSLLTNVLLLHPVHFYVPLLKRFLSLCVLL